MADWADNKIVVVCGPTATGKTEWALELCRRFSGEMVGADSMQIYAGLPVGTAALAPDEAPDVPRHLIGFLSPEHSFSVAEYLAMAAPVIREIQSRGNLPVLCGGTGLYLSCLVDGIRFSQQEVPQALRQKLEQEWAERGGEQMLEKLARKDAEHARKLAPKDKKRILRSLEEMELTGKTYEERVQASRPGQKPYNALCLALEYSDRERHYEKINQRVDKMLQKGILKEAEQVYHNKERYNGVVQAIGYKEFFPYFAGTATREECVAKLKQATRRYAKRQLTWFRKMEQVNWMQVDRPEEKERFFQMADEFLGKGAR